MEIEQQINRLLEQGESDRALALAGEHYPEWLASGRLAEGRECLQRVLDAPPGMETASRVTALLGAGMLEFRQGDDRNARRLFDEALAVARRVGDTAQEARALNSLARVALRGRDPARVQELAREAWRLYEHVGDRPGVATSRHMTAAATRMKGDHAGAAEVYAENLRDAREREDGVFVSVETLNLGYMKLHLGDASGAAPLFEESLRVSSGAGDAYVLPYSLMGMGSLALAQGDPELGARLLAAAKAGFDAGGFAIDPGSDEEFEQGVADARAALGERFEEVWKAGAALGTDDAVAQALANTEERVRPEGSDP